MWQTITSFFQTYEDSEALVSKRLKISLDFKFPFSISQKLKIKAF